MSHWALAYVGKPYADGGEGPDAYGCFGLVRSIYRDKLGIDLHQIKVCAADIRAVVRAFRDHPDYERFRSVHVAAELDVVNLSHAEDPHHVGIWVDADGGGVLHSVDGAGVVFDARRKLALGRWNIIDLYRLRDRP